MSYKLVYKIISCPYLSLDSKKIRHDFIDTIAARTSSYKDRYTHDLFPLSGDDFVATHITVIDCETEDCLGSFKYINDGTCSKYGLEFPIINTLKNYQLGRFYKATSRHIKNLQHKKKKISYIGSLTVSSKLRELPNKRKEVKNMLASAIVHHTNEDSANRILVTGSIPNGSYLFIQWLGFNILYDRPITVSNIGNTPSYIMEWQSWSKAALENAKTFQPLWDKRIITPKYGLDEEEVRGYRVG